MNRYALQKVATPVWARVPGTPFSFVSGTSANERLPGTNQAVPSDQIQRIGEGLDRGFSPESLALSETSRGFGNYTVKGTLAGTVLGSLVARAVSGDAFSEPFKHILKNGISRETLRRLRTIPYPGKVLPAVGAGVGLLGGASAWQQSKADRYNAAMQAAQGLSTEKMLQRHMVDNIQRGVLQKMPLESSRAVAPTVAILGNRGI